MFWTHPIIDLQQELFYGLSHPVGQGRNIIN